MTAPGSGLVVGEEREFLAAGFGARLRAERKAAGMTQADLAAATSITRWNVGRFELGQRRPRASTVSVLARALRPGRSSLRAETLAVELRLLAGSSLREDQGQRARRRRRAVARHLRLVERMEDLPAWVADRADDRRSAAAFAAPDEPIDAEIVDDDEWPPVASPGDWHAAPLALVRDAPRPQDVTRAMLETWPWSQLMDELGRMPWPAQVAAVARAYGESDDEAEDRLWSIYRPPGAPTRL